MDKQPHMEMAQRHSHKEMSKEPVNKVMEEQFLKDLYIFMSKRGTAIERIPHLGFRQIDLFVMYKTVTDFGGYHQVTSQQLWKQVYNRLGGNPRSTSAATCTRRHYEKLLLPYECHKKGILMKVLPHHQPKFMHERRSHRDYDDGLKPAKRRLLPGTMHQSTAGPQSGTFGKPFPLTLHFPQYYHPSPVGLSQCIPVSSSVLSPQRPPSPESKFVPIPSPTTLTDRVKEPLEHLRHLAEQYKTSSGLLEPLNLSVKAPHHERSQNLTSSFGPPSSSKNPKFLNKPSPLYTPHRPPVVRDEEGEPQDGEAEVLPKSSLVKEDDEDVIDLKTVTATKSPAHDSTSTLETDGGTTAGAQTSRSPNKDFTIQTKGSSETGGLDLSHVRPSLPRNNGGKMEIEIPLSMLHTWLRLYGSRAMADTVKLPHADPTLEKQSTQRASSNTDTLPDSMSLQMPLQPWRPAVEALRLTEKVTPGPTPTTKAADHQAPSKSPNHFTSSKSAPSGGLLKTTASPDVYPLDQRDNVPLYSSRSSSCWNVVGKKTQAPPIQVERDFNPFRVQQSFPATKSFFDTTHKAVKQMSDMGPLNRAMMNPSSAMLHLTTEEVIKLKRIISSSS